MSTGLEPQFAFYWRLFGNAKLTPEYKFCPNRRFRFDFAYPKTKVAIELEGGVWVKGRHVRPAGFEKDCEKYNLAAHLGWRVFRLTGKMLKDDPERWCEMIARATGVEAIRKL